ncbi:pilus assembly protein TadG-related protein [Hyalangium versicolor]|uniref:pilus assembly protein TadG-related protein n=1 Tax=Hyalangium versicolor TaxID=2861190 RepID=UPI001CC9B574|nr:pilus assembly protein TadG-related protein [Hyalangium versicolor]
MSSPSPRGQSLLLLCLALLFLVLMVCLTLSFSMKMRDKMETQNVADLAAYSGAVATARTFNSVALTRRAQTGHLVAITSVMSLISWTSMVRADLNSARMAANGCPAAADALAALDEQNAAIEERWHELDARAGVQAYNIQILGNYLAYMQGKMLEDLKESVSGGPKSFAARMSKMASEKGRFPNELHAGPTPVSVGELVHATSGGNDHAMDMAMASRGYGFITRRQVNADLTAPGGILGALGAAGGRMRVVDGGGSAYWGSNLGHGGRADSTWFTWAEDHATLEVTFPGCAPFRVHATAGVKATDKEDTSDDHWWTSASSKLGQADNGMEKQYRHTLMSCWPREFCPNTFIGGMTYNTADQQDENLWAQPKTYALVQRDYRARGRKSQPWELLFQLRFTSTSPGTFDSHGWNTASGMDISVQQALGTGLAYYHRPGHWNEAPNLWNPYWRATLVSADVDASGDLRRGGTDIADTVGGPAAEALRQLVLAGYKGVL